jgi:YidC/Oxa1 family membrane protein insertase
MSTEPNKPGTMKNLPIEIRLLLAFALMGLVVFGTPYFYKMLGIKAPEKTEQQQSAQKTPSTPATSAPATAAFEPTPAQKAASAEQSAAALSAGSLTASSEELVTVDTSLYHIVFSNRGATVKSWTLKKFKNHAGKPLEVVNSAGIAKTGSPFQYEFRSRKPAVDLNQALFHATESNDGLSVDFEYSNNGTSAKKSFVFQKDSYLLQLTSSATDAGQPLAHLLVWRGGFGDLDVHNPSSQENAVRFDVAANKVQHDNAKTAKNGPVAKDGSFSWVGIEDQYFAAVFLPVESTPLQTTIFDDQVKTPFDTSEESFVGVSVGGDAENRLALYLGPKEMETLRALNPKLEQLVDFGWWGLIAKPLFISLRWLNDNWFHNYGWSIIVATVIINMVLFPLKLANLKSMRKMQALQPEIAKINEKYKALPLRDPRQADKNAEMMALYSKAGTNPMSGCIPMLIQMPFLFAFYKVLSVSIALRGAGWLWVDDLSQPEQLAIRVLPVILVVTGFVMQKMTPMATVDPTQQKTMMLMPLMMGFIFYQASSGLVLYWLTGNLVGIAQQWLLNKAMPQPAAPVPAAKDVRKNTRK